MNEILELRNGIPGYDADWVYLGSSMIYKPPGAYTVRTPSLPLSPVVLLHVLFPDENSNTHYALGRAGKGMAASSNVAVDA